MVTSHGPRAATAAAALLAATAAVALAAGGEVAPRPAVPYRGSVLHEQWQPGVPPSAALEVPSPLTRDTQVERVTLKEAIALALEHNPGIAAERLTPTLEREGVFQAQSQFDPAFKSELNYGRAEQPNGSVLAGAVTSVTEDRYANFHLVKLLRTGTQFSIDFLNDRYDNNSAFNQLRPQYKPQLGVSLIQPLLRNFGWDFSYLVVRAAEQNADASSYQFEANLADFVERVVEAYWGVVSAREQVDVQKESKALADRTTQENEARVKVGLLPPVSILEAQADAAAREEQVIIAENNLAVARQNLAQLAYYSPDGTFVPRALEPTEDAEPEDVTADEDRTLATALAERPEILASAHNVRVQQLNEKIAGNGLLPEVDAVGSYGWNGLAGPGRCIQFGGQISCASPFAGNAGDAYRNLPDFRSYAFGVQVQVPIANAAAESQYVQSRIRREQAELGHRDLLSRVTLDVRQSVSDLVAARKRIDSTRVASRLAEENLRNQEKRHEVGMATTKDLLDFQTRLTTARAAEVQATTDYAIAVAKWRRAEGTLLAAYQIVVERPGRPAVPWFARF